MVAQLAISSVGAISRNSMPSSYTNLLYHIVFSTKNRKPLIRDDFQEELYRYIGGIIRAEGGIQLEIGGAANHIHILVKLKPTQSVSHMLNKIKANSSRWINQSKKPAETFAWQEGYGAFTVSESQANVVREYIRRQEEHHHRQSFQEEFLELLRRHDVDYDPRFLPS